MGRRRTSRTKNKRSRRMKGGMKGTHPQQPDRMRRPAAGAGGAKKSAPVQSEEVGAAKAEDAPMYVAPGGAGQINVLGLEGYLSQLNEHIILLLKNANMLKEGSSGYYSYDRETPGTTSRQLYIDLKFTVGGKSRPLTRNLIEAKQDIELMLESIRTGEGTEGLTPQQILAEAEAKRLDH
jgi:hypothetical protein